MGFHVAEFKVSGTWQRPAGVTGVKLFLIGAGQGGSGGSVVSPNWFAGGGGGGGRALDQDINDVDANILVAIGAGGAGGATFGSNGGQTSASIGVRTISIAGGSALGANVTVTSGYRHGGGGGGGAEVMYLDVPYYLGNAAAGKVTTSVSRSQAIGRNGETSASPLPLQVPYVTGGKGRNGFGGGGSAASLPLNYTIPQPGNRASDGGGRGGEWSNGLTFVNGTVGIPNTGGGGGGAVSYGSPGSGGQGGSGYAVVTWWGDRGENLTLWSSPAPRRMVMLDGDVVVDAIETQALTPWLGLGWRDVTNKSFAGQPVSVGWIWNGLVWLPPPSAGQLPA